MAVQVGRVSVVTWEPGGAVATEVNLDANGKPACYETRATTHLRIHEGDRTSDLGMLRYVGRGDVRCLRSFRR